MSAAGMHCILEMYDCPAGLLNDPAYLGESLREAALEARSTLLNEVQHRFEPHGVTALALLAESHISIHTWPETGYCAADVFTCGEHTLPQQACEHLIKKLQARRYSLRTIERGAEVPQVRGSEREPAERDANSGVIDVKLSEDSAKCQVQKFARTSG